MWLSRVWLERCESHKEQNKAFKLLSCSYQRNRTLQKKRKKKQNRTHSIRRSKEEEDEANKSLNFSLNRLLHPIRTDTARVGANQPNSVRIGPSRAGVSRRKKKKRTRHQRAGSGVACATDASAVAVLPRPCILVWDSRIASPTGPSQSTPLTSTRVLSCGAHMSG